AHVDLLPLNGSINPISANYLTGGIQAAGHDGAAAAIIELDTPGGLDSSMRQIVRAMTNAPLPVVVYVAPQGARAGSAGVFITMASSVAAMAPNTNIGAAHPIGLSPTGQPSQPQGGADVEATKVLNDSVAYIRSLAQSHGRNADWAEQAVRSSVSATEQQALEQHIVELEANDVPDLLAKLDGRSVKLPSGQSVTLHTAGVAVNRIDMTPFQQLMAVIADPTWAYLLMLAGMAGLVFELSTPGAIFPGVAGGLSLLLGLLALGALPVNYAGVALIALSLALFVADIKLPSHGVLTAGGVLAFLFGSLALFNTGGSGPAIALPVVVSATATVSLFFAVIVRLGIKARKAPATTGTGQLIGRIVEVKSPIDPTGKVQVDGEWWNAQSDEPIPAGAKVEIAGVRGLTLWVRRLTSVRS
ncbi:MAG: nodulation protein NfeD, partial [Chloroflexota bacterium]|nr:nodulation protein NfeD [Chloroflexota bacterium]